ncbi:MAG: PRC-barrel domain-containing protein [Bacteroidota bacterium]
MNLLSASSIRNTTVTNTQGEDLGTVQDLMIDPQSGRVQYAVLDFGGFLGIGDKLFAVPLEAFDIDRTNERFFLDVNRERLESAPGFDKSNWPSTSDPTFIETVYDYYGKRDVYMRTRVNEPVLSN